MRGIKWEEFHKTIRENTSKQNIIMSIGEYSSLSTAPDVASVNPTLQPGYVTKDLNNIQN